MFPNWLQAILGNDLGGQHQGSAGGYGGLQPVQPYRPRPSSFRELPDDYRRDSKVSALLALAQAIGGAPPGQLGSGIAAGAAGVQQSRRADLERYQDRYDEQRNLESSIARREALTRQGDEYRDLQRSSQAASAAEAIAKRQERQRMVEKIDSHSHEGLSVDAMLGMTPAQIAGLDYQEHQRERAAAEKATEKAESEEQRDMLYESHLASGGKEVPGGAIGWEMMTASGKEPYSQAYMPQPVDPDSGSTFKTFNNTDGTTSTRKYDKNNRQVPFEDNGEMVMEKIGAGPRRGGSGGASLEAARREFLIEKQAHYLNYGDDGWEPFSEEYSKARVLELAKANEEIAAKLGKVASAVDDPDPSLSKGAPVDKDEPTLVNPDAASMDAEDIRPLLSGDETVVDLNAKILQLVRLMTPDQRKSYGSDATDAEIVKAIRDELRGDVLDLSGMVAPPLGR